MLQAIIVCNSKENQWTKPNFEKMAKKPSFGSNFGPNSGRQFFFSKIWLRQSLVIMVGYHHVQYQEKT